MPHELGTRTYNRGGVLDHLDDFFMLPFFFLSPAIRDFGFHFAVGPTAKRPSPSPSRYSLSTGNHLTA